VETINLERNYLNSELVYGHVMLVPVTTAWRILGLQIEDMEGSWNILNKHSRTVDKGWPSSLGVGRGANNSSLQKKSWLRNVKQELRRMTWKGHVARSGEMKNAYKISVQRTRRGMGRQY